MSFLTGRSDLSTRTSGTVDVFSGSGVDFTAGSSTTVTLTADPGTENDLVIAFDGVTQHHDTYSVSATTVTFDTAIPTGTLKIEAKYGSTYAVGTVPDDAVTLAKMASGTDGNLISYDTNGDVAAVATGDSGQILTSNGAGTAPTFQAAAAGGGAWTLIGTQVASASASLTQTGLDSTYDTYVIEFADMIAADDAVQPYFRLGDSSGVDSGASDYSYCFVGNAADSSTPAGSAALTAAQIDLSGITGTGTGESWAAQVVLHQPGDSSVYPLVTFQSVSYTHNPVLKQYSGGGIRLAVITVDRVYFQFNSGNITSGRMTTWGISHA